MEFGKQMCFKYNLRMNYQNNFLALAIFTFQYLLARDCTVLKRFFIYTINLNIVSYLYNKSQIII